MKERYYTMPHYYSWWLKILVWIHVYTMKYCTRWVSRTHRGMSNKKMKPSKTEDFFIKYIVSPIEFRLRKITDRFTNIAKVKYRKTLVTAEKTVTF